MWTYRAAVRRVIDGDTLDVVVDVGFRISMEHRLRVLGVDTPEPRGETRELGRRATEFAHVWLTKAVSLAADPEWPIYVRTVERDSFGRWLSDIWDESGSSLAVSLIEAGHGEQYSG